MLISNIYNKCISFISPWGVKVPTRFTLHWLTVKVPVTHLWHLCLSPATSLFLTNFHSHLLFFLSAPVKLYALLTVVITCVIFSHLLVCMCPCTCCFYQHLPWNTQLDSDWLYWNVKGNQKADFPFKGIWGSLEETTVSSCISTNRLKVLAAWHSSAASTSLFNTESPRRRLRNVRLRGWAQKEKTKLDCRKKGKKK